MNRTPHEAHGTTSSYVIGFIISIGLTLIAYSAVVNKTLAGTTLLLALGGLAAVQLFVQLYFFLHLGKGPNARLNTLLFALMFVIVVIVVGGSLWIMKHLNYHNMTPSQTSHSIIKDEGYQK
jgi:cytochrome o ubiquinol oxidase operon protein cyoD